MHLQTIAIKNYRSITRAHNVSLSKLSVITGKNNEGKSNILHAVTLALNIIEHQATRGLVRVANHQSVFRRVGFDWDLDYPISLQGRKSPPPCVLRLEFQLDQDEVNDFKTEIGSRLNGTIPIEISIGPNSLSVKIVKKGPGSATLEKKSFRIFRFVARRLSYSYIPAVRTSNEALAVVEQMVAQELYKLEGDPSYQAAIDKIALLQAPVLARISELITVPLREFIPQISNATVTISNEARRQALTKCDIYIDDGTKTSIQRKGDGVKSLAAISLLRGLNSSTGLKIIALEEPESHLHPDAMHKLRGVVEELSLSHQVILTTHCPLFVNRQDLASNIIIDNKSARAVKHIDEVRKVLGVRASDNLQNARLVLFVEGECDVIAVSALLGALSPTVKNALRDHVLVVKGLGGASKLRYHASLHESALCDIYVYVDKDQAGLAAVNSMISDGRLKMNQAQYVVSRGNNESEFEDLIRVEVYAEQFKREYGIDVEDKKFRVGKRKWSDRVRDAFEQQGRPFNEEFLRDVKIWLAKMVARSPVQSINEHKLESIKSLVSALEERLVKYR